MAKNPSRMYRKIIQHTYTRREHTGGVPGNRILQYESAPANGDFQVKLTLIAEERGQIRHTALESMRQTAVRALDAGIGRENYHLKVRVYPHHVLRQNKQASGAGADRVSMGMRLAFGKAIGTAARVAPGQTILTVRVPAPGPRLRGGQGRHAQGVQQGREPLPHRRAGPRARHLLSAPRGSRQMCASVPGSIRSASCWTAIAPGAARSNPPCPWEPRLVT